MNVDTDKLKSRRVRLFPSHHIRSAREAELRAAASLLAMVKAVSEFGRAVVDLAGAPKGTTECYTEVPFTSDDAKHTSDRPDGLIRVHRGKTEWTALVEVKVGDADLEQEQFERYHRLASDEGLNALITVSNQAALPNGLPPAVSVDGRRLRRVSVVHISWQRLLSEARVLSRRKEVADPDQQWMLEEWIRYVADPASRIIERPQLGKHWNDVLSAARQGNLAGVAPHLHDVVVHWDAFLRKLALRLRAKLGVEVQLRTSRSERADPESRFKTMQTHALDCGELTGTLRIPGAAGHLAVTVLLASKTVRYGMEVDAPTEGRAKTRANWLLRQLNHEDTPRDLSIHVHWDARGLVTQARFDDSLADTEVLLRDPAGVAVPRERSPRSFLVERTVALDRGRGRSTAPVLQGIADGVEAFYRDVVERIRAYQPRAPRFADTDEHPVADTPESVPSDSIVAPEDRPPRPDSDLE